MNIITLTLNPAIDVHCTGENIITFSENLFKVESRDMGGKGINISRALNVAGIKNRAILILGEDGGKDFSKELSKEKINHKTLFVNGRIRENITLHTKDGETRISFEGFSVDDAVLDKLKDAIFSEFTSDSVVVLAGRLPSGLPVKKVRDLLKELKNKGAKIIIDSKSFGREDVFDIGPYLIKPNEEEIFEYSAISDLSIESVKKAATELRNSGISNVLISLGKNGAYLSSDEGDFYGEAPKIPVISTIGAGDSTVAGFISGIAMGLTKEEALRQSIAFGSAACMTEGTLAPKKEDIEKLISEIKIIKG